MRRITMAIMTTIAALVLLFSYRTSTSGPATGSATVAGAAPAGVVDDPQADPTPTPAATGAPKNATVNGPAVQTRWGPVQVQVKITGGRIADVVTLIQPDANNRDVEINSRALPILRTQVIDAQSAHIDGVSGATVTSDGYVESLQAALDTAGFPS
ncbi:FMN-binding protein [Catellatospora chokoriensis]|uniref:FMN-binding protein n=1 Tax=Catellatospora chokoriensis TaxID=310353 RepID=A0A8J3KAE6_9ACTN|nr:FMN-binding protein [Catellatospora chokoriensis]GIF93033.1 FMN-binding protein [Catellatospora chokoriensis]